MGNPRVTRARGEEPKQQIQPGSRCLLVVEGNDECVLAKRVGLPQGTTVLDLGGMDDGTKLEQYATVVGLDPSFFALTSVGVVGRGGRRSLCSEACASLPRASRLPRPDRSG